ncbi:40S ribosomal protein S1 [Dissostichus eleginoides]|uniref:40S ribosomal protein S1 n=1 Tax=Dissostichus eleginoides TaxID=100907 RepID=A0AAD9CGQ3_DISEL|nr:40S ribosomal protein S1 [Dissostichus eleginoides]
MWNGIKALTDYKSTNLLPSNDAELPDVLNQFFARFDTPGGESAPLIHPPAEETMLVLQRHQLITDYFLTALVEVAPLSGSDSESDSPDTDSSPQTTDAEDEEDTTEDGPLVSDPVAETLQTAAGYYVSEDSANETEKAHVFSMPLPGRIQGFKRTDIRVLPTTETKSSVWRKYKAQMQENGHRAAGNSTFRKLWKELIPSVVIGRPMRDLCWFCQKNNMAICLSSNLPDCVKSAKLRKQEEHLRTVGIDRETTIHYTFDYAQQVHYPSDPLQPGPIYFLVPRKCGVFGVCSEGVPQQVNYLIDEAHCSSKDSIAVISYLHHFFSQYGLGVKHVLLHCVNCSGQNKNRYLIWYIAWRFMVGLHATISLNFLIAPQLVGNESGETFVKTDNWHDFLAPSFRPLPGIRRYHHIRFTSAEPGAVYAKELVDNQEESYMLLRPGGVSDRVASPTELSPPGLDGKRQWYLYERIREFCTEEAKDITCPKPSTLHC